MTRARAAASISALGALLAVFVRWYFVTHAHVLQPLDEPGGWGDAAEYYRYAWNIVHHGIFSGDVAGTVNPRPDSYRDPAYPAVLAFWMALTGTYDGWYAAVLLFQAALGGITVACTVLAIRDALPPWLLAIGALAIALWPHSVSMTSYVLTENLSAPLCAMAALALREAAVRESLSATIAGGLALAAAGLTNAVIAPLIVPLVAVFAWKRAMPWRRLFALTVVTVLPLLAWNVRNLALPTGTSASFRAEINLVQGSWPTYHTASQLWGRRDPVGIQTINAIEAEVMTLHTDRVAGLRLMTDRMRLAPGTYLAWYLSKPMLLWGWEIGLGSGDIYVYPTRDSPFMTQPLKAVEAIAYIFNGVLALLALGGLVITIFRRAPPPAMLAFAITAGWITCVYGVLQSDARYSIPFRGAEISLAMTAVWSALQYFSSDRAGRPTQLR
jgi:hypothetical protein